MNSYWPQPNTPRALRSLCCLSRAQFLLCLSRFAYAKRKPAKQWHHQDQTSRPDCHIEIDGKPEGTTAIDWRSWNRNPGVHKLSFFFQTANVGRARSLSTRDASNVWLLIIDRVYPQPCLLALTRLTSLLLLLSTKVRSSLTQLMLLTVGPRR